MPDNLRKLDLCIASAAAQLPLGEALIGKWDDAEGHVYILDGVEVENYVPPRRSKALIVGTRPRIGWIKPADHGSLFVRPGEHYLTPVRGCTATCKYCYLQPDRLRPLYAFVDINDLGDELSRLLGSGAATGCLLATGELADSLGIAADIGLVDAIVRLVAQAGHARLELRSKFSNIECLRDVEHRGSTTVAFSVMPDSYSRMLDVGTDQIAKRVEAAQRVLRWGYRVAFKCEPLILGEDWEYEYSSLWGMICALIDSSGIEHISLGGLRWNEDLGPRLARSPNMSQLMRYPDEIRYRPNSVNYTISREVRLTAYRRILRLIREHGIGAQVYLSLESAEIVSELEQDLARR